MPQNAHFNHSCLYRKYFFNTKMFINIFATKKNTKYQLHTILNAIVSIFDWELKRFLARHYKKLCIHMIHTHVVLRFALPDHRSGVRSPDWARFTQPFIPSLGR